MLATASLLQRSLARRGRLLCDLAAPPPPRAERPWRVLRSATGNLPVYTDYRVGGTKKVTILRKYQGDVEALKAELEQVTGREVVQFHGRLEVKGADQRSKVVDWLRSLGF